MKIELRNIPVRNVYEGYLNDEEEGVVGYGGKLDIRPKYQREFIYKDAQRNEVIHTVRKGFPLNVMYWVKNADGKFELLDGQQRTLSLCTYIYGDFMLDWDGHLLGFSNLSNAQRDSILNYELMVYICEGTDAEILDWFKIVNIAGEVLSEQELRNAVYTGEWLTDAKRYFSKRLCAAKQIGEKYLNGDYLRQDYLETAIKWISNTNDDTAIQAYMAEHQHDQNANALWLYFQNVINWINALFPRYRSQMKGVPWGSLYNRYKDNNYNTDALEREVSRLMADDDVSNKKGVFSFIFTRQEKFLNIRAFSNAMKDSAYERQRGICPVCKRHFECSEMDADHITPWIEGGKTAPENCQMLCRACNRRKGAR